MYSAARAVEHKLGCLEFGLASILQTCTECSGLLSFLKEHSYFYAIAFSRTILRMCQGTLVQKLKKNVRCIKKEICSLRKDFIPLWCMLPNICNNTRT